MNPNMSVQSIPKSRADAWKVGVGYVLGVLGFGICFWSAFAMREDLWLNLLCVTFGGTFGWVVGMLATPKGHSERRQFIRYGQALATFASGYVVAKFDDAIDVALKRSDGVDELLIGRLLLVGASFFLGALFTFVGRRYLTVILSTNIVGGRNEPPDEV